VLGGMPTLRLRPRRQAVRDRQVLYWFALTTAFRANECASLLWEDLTLDGAKPCVRLAGTFTKNGDDANIPLQPSSPRLSAKCGSGAALQVKRTVRAGSRDGCRLQCAQQDRRDRSQGRAVRRPDPVARADQQAGRLPLRCARACARILIELNVHPKVIQQVLRHSDIRLTMDLYGELGEDDLFRDICQGSSRCHGCSCRRNRPRKPTPRRSAEAPAPRPPCAPLTRGKGPWPLPPNPLAMREHGAHEGVCEPATGRGMAGNRPGSSARW
jgi:hypothetical protein